MTAEIYSRLLLLSSCIKVEWRLNTSAQMGTRWGISFSGAVTSSAGEQEELSLWVRPWRVPWISCFGGALPINWGFHWELGSFIHAFHEDFSSVYHLPGTVGKVWIWVTSCPRFPKLWGLLGVDWDSWSPYFGGDHRMKCSLLSRVSFPRSTYIKVTWVCLLKCKSPGRFKFEKSWGLKLKSSCLRAGTWKSLRPGFKSHFCHWRHMGISTNDIIGVVLVSLFVKWAWQYYLHSVIEWIQF